MPSAGSSIPGSGWQDGVLSVPIEQRGTQGMMTSIFVSPYMRATALHPYSAQCVEACCDHIMSGPAHVDVGATARRGTAT